MGLPRASENTDARQPTHVGFPTVQQRALGRERRGIDRQADEFSHDPAVTAEQDPCDDFLANVATFRRADRPSLDARFQRNGGFVHVDAKLGSPGFDPEHFGRVRIQIRASAREQRLVKTACLVTFDVEMEPHLPQVVDARHNHRRPVEAAAGVPVVRIGGDLLGCPAYSRLDWSPEHGRPSRPPVTRARRTAPRCPSSPPPGHPR